MQKHAIGKCVICFSLLANFAPGGMAERSIAAVLKTVDPARGPGVRIPLPPQIGCEEYAWLSRVCVQRQCESNLILTKTCKFNFLRV